jgi:hypothetical protein
MGAFLDGDCSAVLGEVAQPSVHRGDLRFEVGDGVAKVPRRGSHLGPVIACELAQGSDRDRYPTHTMLETIALEHRPQRVGGGGSCHGQQAGNGPRLRP